MRAIAITLIMASAMSAHAAPFDCKPAALPNGEGQGGEPFLRVNESGVVLAWGCKASPNLQMSVATWPWVFAHVPELIQFARDPSHARMNSMVDGAPDWRTDPKLREVWLPYKAQIDALQYP